jgi:ABC-type transport system involved in multi-copper enzyme maturation permease subunit
MPTPPTIHVSHPAAVPVAPGYRQPLAHLMRGVWLQALRRNEVHVVGILLALYLLGSLALRIVGIESEQTARFATALGLELGSILSSALVIVMGARQIPAEIEQRTIYPVLARPITRGQLLLGKGLPTWLLGAGGMLLFLLVTAAATPHMAYQRADVLLQALFCKGLALAMLTALVFWLALWLPSSMTMLISGTLVFLGSIPINWIGGLGGGGVWIAGLLPDFKLLEQFSRFVDGGGPIGGGMFVRLAVYGVVWTGVFCGLATVRFRRQPL